MNIFSDDLTILNAILVGENWAVKGGESGTTFSFINLWRYLWFQALSSGTVVLSDPSGVGSNVTLGSDDTQMSVYDLSSISWLTSGQVYEVTGAKYAVEDSTG